MYLFLLKKALPFTLTFVFGAALSGLVGLFGTSEKKAESVVTTRTYEFGSRCRMRRHNLVALTKPLRILYKPDARRPFGPEAEEKAFEPVQVTVTFGADGKIKAVTPTGGCFSDEAAKRLRLPSVTDEVERAALMIQFEPETVDGMPVTVTREVEIRFAD